MLNMQGLEFATIQNSILNQLNSAKWNRWLYRYSINHRKILKNSHKITLAKRLMNSGFFNNDLFNKNLWAAENFIKYENNKNALNSFVKVFYPYLLEENHTWAAENFQFNKTTKLWFLNFYEQSYFWFLKRFYLFNSLYSNIIKDKKISRSEIFHLNNDFIFKNNQLFYYFNLSSFFFKSFTVNNYAFENFFKIYDSNPYFNLPHKKNINYHKIKDFFLMFSENSILVKDNLDILYWVSANSANYSNLNFFTYNIFSTNAIDFCSNFEISKIDHHSDLLIISENLYRLDLFLNTNFF
jgi:hypothetical protein